MSNAAQSGPPAVSGPPAPGRTAPRPALPTIDGASGIGAWRTLTRALGRDLQGGMHRAEQARRRIARMR